MYTALGRIVPILLVALLAIAPLAVPAGAVADTFTFDTTSGDWDDPQNWDPNTRAPEAGDTAIILTGQTCIVAEDDQAAAFVEVEDGATLRIDGRSLAIDGHWLVVDGVLEIEDSGGIVYHDNAYSTLYLSGAGTVDASDGQGLGPGFIGTAAAEQADLNIGGNLTIKGGITFVIDGDIVVTWGSLVVDDADDVMNLGPAGPGGAIGFIYGGAGGLIAADAGVMRIRRMSLGWDGSLSAINGTLDFAVSAVSHFMSAGSLIVAEGGTLNVDSALFHMQGCLSLNDATIRVAEGSIAQFIADCSN